MEVSSIAADAVESRPLETSRKSWKAILPSIAACPAGQAVVVNLGAVSEKALKQARWNLRSACKNDVESDAPTLQGVPEIVFGKEPGTLIVKPFVSPVPATPAAPVPATPAAPVPATPAAPAAKGGK